MLKINRKNRIKYRKLLLSLGNYSIRRYYRKLKNNSYQNLMSRRSQLKIF